MALRIMALKTQSLKRFPVKPQAHVTQIGTRDLPANDKLSIPQTPDFEGRVNRPDQELVRW